MGIKILLELVVKYFDEVVGKFIEPFFVINFRENRNKLIVIEHFNDARKFSGIVNGKIVSMFSDLFPMHINIRKYQRPLHCLGIFYNSSPSFELTWLYYCPRFFHQSQLILTGNKSQEPDIFE